VLFLGRRGHGNLIPGHMHGEEGIDSNKIVEELRFIPYHVQRKEYAASSTSIRSAALP